MKTVKSITLSALLFLLPAWSVHAQSLVEFGNLYGSGGVRTIVTDGGGDPLGESLEGIGLWFLCLEQPADDPSNEPPYSWEYTLGTDPGVLTGGALGGIPAGDLQSILTGISNIYFNNEAAVYADTASDGSSFDTPGSAMQRAAWAITNEYGSTWSGELDSSKISAILTANPGYAGTLVETYLNSSLVDSGVAGRVLFGSPSGSTPGTFQNVMLFSAAPLPIPEPSAALLGLAAAGMMLTRRRRTVTA